MSSDGSDDDFVSYGTALEQLDEDLLPRKKTFSLEDQVARDSKGKRRFHGAFTGGFSAGFMNTAGSLEGWKPTEFKSSRKERKEVVTQMPEQFMDDEDIGEFGIAPQRITIRSEYTKNQDKPNKRHFQEYDSGPIPGTPVLDDLLKPVRESVGVNLLKNMGWRPGQGVGPRVTKKEKQKMYGCALPQSNESDDNSDGEVEFENVTFAPDNIRPFIIAPKKNSFGLGYSGLERHSVLGQSNLGSQLKFTDQNKKINIRGQAFGVGAFEEEDEDIYSREDMSQYDFELRDESTARKAVTAAKVPGILDGFVSSKSKVIRKIFAAPVLPSGFKPRHTIRKTRFEPSRSPAQRVMPTGLGRHELNTESRAQVLGETSDQSSSTEVLLPSQAKIEQERATQSSTFRPFQADADKQERYDLYLTLTDKGKLSELQPVHMSQWEREREKKEFQQAERIFRPLTGIMEDRFTSATHVEDFNNPLAVVEKIKHGKDSQRDAAKMKMYGPLTRETFPWKPCSLICKRFNVPDPESCVQAEPRKSKFSIFDSLDHLIKEEPKADDPTPLDDLQKEPESQLRDDIPSELVNVPPIEVVEQEPIFIDPVSKVDLFKAIFLESSDEEDNTGEDTSLQVSEVTYDEPIRNVARNKSPPRGLFANVDLEALTTRPGHIPPPQPILLHPKGDVLDERCSDLEMQYGPKLPDKIVPKQQREEASSSSEDSWEEKQRSKSKKVKKDRKQKKHKRRHKKKKKSK